MTIPRARSGAPPDASLRPRASWRVLVETPRRPSACAQAPNASCRTYVIVVAIEGTPISRRALVALVLIGPIVAAVAVASGASRMVERQRRSATTARDLTTFFGAAYRVLAGAEAAQRALASALAARDTGVRFVPQYQTAAAALRGDMTTVSRLIAGAPECAGIALDVARSFDDAGVAGDRVVDALRGHDHERAVVAGYEFQAAITLTRDAAQALVQAAAATLPRQLAGPPPVTNAPLWAGALGTAVVALVLCGALTRLRLRAPTRSQAASSPAVVSRATS
jgi:hypothetical protein